MLIADYPAFRPHPLLSLGHFQTIAPIFIKGRRSKYRAEKHVVHLFDGDRIVVHDDEPSKWIHGDRIAILLHGLVGNHLSPYVVRCADKLRRHGVRTIRVDMRGFGDSTLISRSHIHGGCSPDLDSVIEFAHQLSPLSKISIIGYSIGGNIALKAAGNWGENYPRHVDSIVSVSPPVDLNRSIWSLMRQGNRIYENYFVNKLRNHLLYRRRKVKGLVDNGLNPLPSRLLHFDDQFTAPLWGYSGAREYYEKCSSGPNLKSVSVPTVILASHDDPIVPFEMFSEFQMSNYIDLIETRSGGHLGFIGKGARDPDRFWMDWRICQWVMSQDERTDKVVEPQRKSRFR
jgi:predicted alpha/beta-fold hydrolase